MRSYRILRHSSQPAHLPAERRRGVLLQEQRRPVLPLELELVLLPLV